MNQKGFSQIILLGIVAVIILAGAGGVLVLQEKKIPFFEKLVQQDASSEDVTSPIALGDLCSGEKECNEFCLNNRGRCEEYCQRYSENLLCRKLIAKVPSSGASNQTAPAPQQNLTQQTIEAEFKFTRFPFDIENIGSVAPVGEFSGITRQTVANAHYYGNMRHYIFSKKPGEYAYNVYAPADGEITGFRNEATTGEFRFNFKINNKSFYYLDHIQSLSAEILEKLKPYFGSPLRLTRAVEQVSPSIPIKAGFVLGQTGLKGIAWDWGVIDANYCQNMLHPEHYAQDPCPRSVYDFMDDAMKAQIAPLAGYWSVPPGARGSLQVVKTTPVLGQYAHDVAGTLSGGWFKEYKSWQNVFFVPDPYEPDTFQIRLAIPELSVFGVWNRIALGTGSVNPDPKKVTPASGIVSYALPLSNARDNNEHGVLLVRVNNDATITVETLSEATSVPTNPQFTNKAMILKR